jgi:hypothetical protein
MNLFFVLKIVAVFFFLIMFVRRANWVWGIGLLTVTTAVFLDTVFSVFGGADLLEQSGFFYYVVAGFLVGGAAVWLFGLLWPHLNLANANAFRPRLSRQRPAPPLPYTNELDNSVSQPRRGTSMANEATAYDRQQLYDQIRFNLGPDDVYDLIFDLEMNENDVLMPHATFTETIINIMDQAQEGERMGEMALAVERILTPIPADHMPRLDRLSSETPPAILRRYLLTFYFADQLRDMAQQLNVDWEQLGHDTKQTTVRTFLLYLLRRNRLPELIDMLQAQGTSTLTPASPTE